MYIFQKYVHTIWLQIILKINKLIQSIKSIIIYDQWLLN